MRDDFGNLETQLNRLGSALAYPATPDLTTGILNRIAQTSERHKRPAALGSLGVALAGLFVAIASVVAIAAPARNAVADLFDRIEIFQTDEVPLDLPTDIRGETVSLDEAEQRFGARILVSTNDDGASIEPVTVIHQEFPPSDAQAVASFFETDNGVPYMLLQTDGILGKGLTDEASAKPVSGVGDGNAYWLEGLRIVQLYDSNGNFLRESQRRTDASTLIWITNGLVMRLEGDLPMDEAVEIAKSVG